MSILTVDAQRLPFIPNQFQRERSMQFFVRQSFVLMNSLNSFSYQIYSSYSHGTVNRLHRALGGY